MSTAHGEPKITVERPLCECHGEPMHQNGNWRGPRRWRCRVRNNERGIERYATMTGLEYSHRLLGLRRAKALRRMAERKERHGSLPSQG